MLREYSSGRVGEPAGAERKPVHQPTLHRVQGTPLLDLGDPTDVELIIDVLSTDAVKITPGCHIVIEYWGGDYPLHTSVRLAGPSEVVWPPPIINFTTHADGTFGTANTI